VWRCAIPAKRRHDLGERVTWNGQPWQIINVGETEIWLLFKGDSEQEKVVELSRDTFQSLVQAAKARDRLFDAHRSSISNALSD